VAERHVETVRRIYDAWEKGDFTTGVGYFDEYVILVMDPEFPDAGVHPGVEGVRRYMKGLLEAFDDFTITAESIEGDGDTVIVKVNQRGTGKDSGIEVANSYFQLWTFRGDAVIRLESIKKEERARAALGSRG
jgi:ketosteroid isomerase-like protein